MAPADPSVVRTRVLPPKIGIEQRVPRQLVQAAGSLLTVDIGVLQELRRNPHPAGDHVQVGGGSVVIDADGVLLDPPETRA